MKGYWINLDKRTDRAEAFLKASASVTAVQLERFVALDGSSITEFPKGLRSGRHYALNLNIIEILNKALEQELEAVAIFEDDVDFAPDFDQRFNACVNSLPADWDLFYLGHTTNQYADRYFNANLNIPDGPFWGCWAFCVNAPAIPKVIEALERQHTACDELIRLYCHPAMKVFVASPFMCTVADGFSDLNQQNRSMDHIRKFYSPEYTPAETERIPKVIHQIWLGPKPIPDAVFELKEMNEAAGWSHCLWTDDDVPGELINHKHFYSYYPEHRSCWNGKANILRYEILHMYGGVYIDADSIPLRPLDDELLDNDSFAVFENEKARPGLIANGVIGATAGNLLMSLLIDRIRLLPTVLHDASWKLTGPQLLTDVVKQYGYKALQVLPSYMFYPNHFTGASVPVAGVQPYTDQKWGTTKNLYGKEAINWSGADAAVFRPEPTNPRQIDIEPIKRNNNRGYGMHPEGKQRLQPMNQKRQKRKLSPGERARLKKQEEQDQLRA